MAKSQDTTPRAIKFDQTIYIHPDITQDDQRLLELFADFQFDIENLQHWRRLLVLFSEQHFERGRGRPKKWDGISLFHLCFSVLKKNKGTGRRLSHLKIATLIKKDLDIAHPLYKTSATEIAKRLAAEMRAIERKTMPPSTPISPAKKSDIKKSRA